MTVERPGPSVKRSVPEPRTAPLDDGDARPRSAPIEAQFRRGYAEAVRLAVCLIGELAQAHEVAQGAFVSLDRPGIRLRDHDTAADRLRSAVIVRSRRGASLPARERSRVDNLLVDAPGGIDDERDGVPGGVQRRMDRAVLALPRLQREVLVCRCYLGLEVAAVAALLRLPAWFVATLRLRALKALGDHHDIAQVAEVEQHVRDDLHASASRVIVSDRDVDEAWWRLQGRIAERSARRTRRRVRARAAAVSAVVLVAGAAAWQEVRGTDAAPPDRMHTFPSASYDCVRPTLSALAANAAAADGFVATRRDLAAADEDDCRPVVSFAWERGWSPGNMWVFADGRVVTAGGYLQGYWQRRLTPQGIEQVRSAAAGMLHASSAEEGPVEVRHGRTLVRLAHPARFAHRLFDLSWLPRSAWREEIPAPYEGLWQRVCFAGGHRPLGKQQTLDLFAYPANDSLSTLGASPQPVVHVGDEPRDSWRQTPYCAVVSGEKVMRLFDLVKVAGLLPEGEDGFWADRVEVPGKQHAWITVTVVMPNGELSVLDQ